MITGLLIAIVVLLSILAAVPLSILVLWMGNQVTKKTSTASSIDSETGFAEDAELYQRRAKK